MKLKETLKIGSVLALLGSAAAFMLQNGPQAVAANACGWTGKFFCGDGSAEPVHFAPSPVTTPSTLPPQQLTKTASPTAAPPIAAPATSPIGVSLDPVLRTENGALVGLMQLRLKNEGAASAHVAWNDLAHFSEVILDNGAPLRPAGGSNYRPKGVADCGRTPPDRCWERYASNFTIIDPGQTVTAYAYYSQKLVGLGAQEFTAVKTVSLSAKLYVVVPETSFRRLQPVDFKEIAAQNMVH